MKSISLLITILMAIFYFNFALADVFINLEQLDEISISNTQTDDQYTFKIVEPKNTDLQLSDPLLALVDDKNVLRLGHSQLPFNNEVLAAAKETSVDAALIHAVIATESKHNAKAISSKGARGLMQLMPATARRFNVQDKNDPKQNILAGSKYLRELLILFKGDLKLTLAAYNAGPGAVQKYKGRIPPYRETMHYVPKVLKYYRQYS